MKEFEQNNFYKKWLLYRFKFIQKQYFQKITIYLKKTFFEKIKNEST